MKVFLDKKGHPYIKLHVIGKGQNIELDFLIDTGFSGGISIPQSFKNKTNFQVISRVSWELADGSEIEMDIYLGRIRIGKSEKEIATIFINGKEGLAGIEFLRGRKFLLDLKKRIVKLS